MELLIFVGFLCVCVGTFAFLSKVSALLLNAVMVTVFNKTKLPQRSVYKSAKKAAPAATSNLKSFDMDIMSITIPSKVLEAVDYSKYESPTYLRKGGVVF